MLNLPLGNTTKNLIKETSVYGTGALVNKLIPILLLPILTRYLSPAEYGLVSIFTVSVAIMVNFIGMTLPAAIQRNFIDHTKTELREYIGTAFLISTLALFFWLLVLYFFSRFSVNFIYSLPMVACNFSCSIFSSNHQYNPNTLAHGNKKPNEVGSFPVYPNHT